VILAETDCRLDRRIARYAAKGRVVRNPLFFRIQRECPCPKCRYAVRVRAIHEENAAAAVSRISSAARCPRCGCGPRRLRDGLWEAGCIILLPGAAGLGQCVPAGVLGSPSCSACMTGAARVARCLWDYPDDRLEGALERAAGLSPAARLDPRTWNLPDPETVAELVRLGLAVPTPSTSRPLERRKAHP
jgi:hypothetical protein